LTLCLEIFTAPGCNRCGRALELAQRLSEEPGNQRLSWRRVDVVEELDYAVQRGIRFTPAFVLDGKLLFRGMPAEQPLRDTVLKQLARHEG